MAVATTIPVSITPEATALARELGIEVGFQKMLDYALQCVPNLRHVEVRVADPPDYPDDPRILIDAFATYREGDPPNPGWENWAHWVGRNISPDVSRYVCLLTPEELSDER